MARNTALKARINEANALALRLNEPGITYDEIAQRLGLGNRQAAHSAVNRPLQRSIAKNAEEYMALDFSRTEAMIESVWPFATNDIDQALQYIGKGKDQKPLMCDPNDGEEHRHDEEMQVCWVLPSQAMISGQQNVIKLLERRAKYGGLDHSDKIAERKQALDEAQTIFLVQFLQDVVNEAGLSEETRAKVLSLAAEKMRAVAIDTTSKALADDTKPQVSVQ